MNQKSQFYLYLKTEGVSFTIQSVCFV